MQYDCCVHCSGVKVTLSVCRSQVLTCFEAELEGLNGVDPPVAVDSDENDDDDDNGGVAVITTAPPSSSGGPAPVPVPHPLS